MPKGQNIYLVELIQSLTKAEKRNFKLYVNRNFGEKEFKSVLLFDVIDKNSTNINDKIENKFKNISSNSLSNLKAHLYEQILISIKLLQRQLKEIKCLDLISYAKVLYSKGLYSQSLSLLKKAKEICTQMDDKNLHLSIVNLEKQIELLHNTESHPERASDLIHEEQKHLNTIINEQGWANLSLELYDYYLKYGHIKNEVAFKDFQEEFDRKILKTTPPETFLSMIQKEMSYTWFYFISQDFLNCYRHARKWINLFESKPKSITTHPILYLKGLHNALSAIYYCNKPKLFELLFQKFDVFIQNLPSDNDRNLTAMVRAYSFTHDLNRVFLSGDFSRYVEQNKEVESIMIQLKPHLNLHRYFLFQYKLACLYFGAGNYAKCIKYLNLTINSDSTHIRQDVQCFSRILKLIVHFEREEDEFLEYQIKNTYRFLLKMDDIHKIQTFLVQFLRKAIHKDRSKLENEFKSLFEQIQQIQFEKYETRPLLYLDLHGWLLGKINKTSTQYEIQKRQNKR